MAGMSSCKNGDAASLKYEKYKLDNGLEVVLHEDKSDPVVSVAIQYHVGSNREKPGKTGFAHFFEHMLFQRSENLPRNAFFQKIDAMGGSFNGGTSNDGTVYFETVPRDALEKVLWMESDRMGYFINTVTEGGLKREIDVVSNEKRQGENVPYGLAFDLVFKNLFPEGHPYSWTVIGEIPDLRSATVEDVKEFYNKYYTTSNATLVVAGDFDVAKTKELIQKYFGEIPARPKPEAPVVQNVTLDSTKRISYEDAFCNAPMIVMTYPAVEAYNEDGYALDFLCNLLAGDKKSPMYKVLVEERKLVPSVDMFNYQLEIAGLALLNATTFPGVNLNDVYAGIEEAYARFEKEGVDPKDLERYKNIEETRTYNRLVSTNGKAIAIVFKRCRSVYDENKRFSPVYDENETLMLPADKVIFAIGQSIVWGDMLAGEKVELGRAGRPVADSLTYQTAQEDIFVGGDLYTGPKFAIDAIAAGHEAAESLHRFVQHGHMTIGRNRRQFIELDKDDIRVDHYDVAARQVAENHAVSSAFRDGHGTLTEEQVKIETARCLECGATVVDPNKCIGCGLCTTKCKFDAISLHRDHPEASKMVVAEDKFKHIMPYMLKRAAKIAFTRKKKD